MTDNPLRPNETPQRPKIGIQADLVRLANYLAYRVEADEAFRRELAQDTVSVLLREGVPEDLVRATLNNQRLAPGSNTAGICVDFTCWSSNCPGTCSVTSNVSWSCYC